MVCQPLTFLLALPVEGAPSTLTGTRPLVIQAPSGRDALCVFTSPARSRGIQKRAPSYSSGLEIEFGAVLAGMPRELGMVLNPGTLFSMETTAEGLAEVRGSPT